MLALASSGCATLFSGTSEDVAFTSHPPGAQVLIDGEDIGRTPLTYRVDRSTFRRSEVTLRMAGYRSEAFPLRRSLNSTALFNCTSILSWGTDALTGAMMEYSPNKYFVELTPKGPIISTGHRRALQFVLVSHHGLIRDITRRRGEYLQTLGYFFGADAASYPRFVSVLGANAPSLVHYEHPHELFLAIERAVAPAGFLPVDCGCSRFENDGRLGVLTPSEREPALAALVASALRGEML